MVPTRPAGTEEGGGDMGVGGRGGPCRVREGGEGGCRVLVLGGCGLAKKIVKTAFIYPAHRVATGL